MISFNKRVSLYSFILTVLVIWIHSVSPAGPAPFPGNVLQDILGLGLGQIAVPGFFCLSGYLFFRNYDIRIIGLDPAAAAGFFIRKWKSRFFSLLLPFLIWNIFYYMVYILCGRAELSPAGILEAAVDNAYNPVFWYIKQLIILTLLTPLTALIITIRPVGVLSLAAVFMSAVFYDLLPFHIVNEDAYFYYAAGAFSAVHFKDMIEDRAEGGQNLSLKCRAALTALLMAVFLISQYLYFAVPFGYRFALFGAVLGRISGVADCFLITGMIKAREGKDRLPGFMYFNFFVYAAHYLEIRFFRLLFVLLGAGPVITETAGFILMPALCIASSYAVGSVIKRLMPDLYRIVTGGRS